MRPTAFLFRFGAWCQRRQTAARQADQLRDFLVRHCGPGTYLDPTVQILGCAHVRIGANCTVGEHSWLNVNEREPGAVGIVIGANCFLGRRNFLNSGARIELGDYCLTGVDCHFLGADHVFTSPLAPYLTTGMTSGGDIRIGANCWLGARVTVLKGVTIGHGSVIGAGAVVTRDVPPFSIAVGHPAKVVRRFDPSAGCWVAAADFTPEAEVRLPEEATYLAQLRAQWPVLPMPRIASGWRAGNL